MSRKEILLERDKKMRELVIEGRAASEIAERLGLEEDYVQRQASRIADELGIVRAKRPSRMDKTPFGMSADSQRLRRNLGNELYYLKQDDNLHKLEVAELTGIPQKAQLGAWERPHNYNWSITQIERLARARGRDFTEFMMEMLTK
ncbi:MAG: hypothetical protein ACTHJR_18090 [Sphingomonas sp.]|uniref:hypothetical protein n=1 Tax=Sphingomonas sp. TaxID=28214 RepID=UPI003F7EADA9